MTDCVETEQKPLIQESKLEGENHTKEKNTTRTTENALTECHLEQQNLIMHMNIGDVKRQNTTSQLHEAKKENKQLLNILQQNDVQRSQVDLSSTYSTMSIVNLQCKYEELSSKYDGLLKVVLQKDTNIKRCHKESASVIEDVNCTLNKLHACEPTLKKAYDKYLALKKRKDSKIDKLKNAKRELQLAHSRTLQLLHQEYLKHGELLQQKLHKTSKPEKAILLLEIHRANKLQHENVLLKQEIACLKSNCIFSNLLIPKTDSEEKLTNNT